MSWNAAYVPTCVGLKFTEEVCGQECVCCVCKENY